MRLVTIVRESSAITATMVELEGIFKRALLGLLKVIRDCVGLVG